MCLLWLTLICGDLHDLWHATEAVDVFQPILIKLLVDDAVVARGVVEAVLIGNDADVRQATEEHERPKLELLLNRRRRETCKQVTRAHSFEVDSRRLENTPHKSRTVEPVWSRCSPSIWRSETLIDRCHE